MPTLMSTAKRAIDAARKRPGNAGLVLTTTSESVNRPHLAAWALTQAAKHTQPDAFRGVYISRHVPLLIRARHELASLRRRDNKPLDDYLYAEPQPYAGLQSFTYMSLPAVLQVGDRIAPKEVAMLVLDERTPGELNVLVPLVIRIQPGFTLVTTSAQPSSSSPWRQFGEPILLAGQHTAG